MNEHILFENSPSILDYGRVNLAEMAVEGREVDEQIEHCTELIVQVVVSGSGEVKQLRQQVQRANAYDKEVAMGGDDHNAPIYRFAHHATRAALKRVKNDQRLRREQIKYNLQKRFERNRLNGTLEEYETQSVIYQDK